MTKLTAVAKLLYADPRPSDASAFQTATRYLAQKEFILTTVTEQCQRPSGPGLVQVFTGNGKGKTTAALGVVLRAVGHGLRAFVVYFMKGEYPYGEVGPLGNLPGVTLARFGLLSFCDPENVKEEEKEEARKALQAAREAMLSGNYDLVVLDEVNVAAAWGLVEVAEVERLVKDRPPQVELILTGRYADPRLIELADLVTEMAEVKHPYAQGVEARRGIDY